MKQLARTDDVGHIPSVIVSKPLVGRQRWRLVKSEPIGRLLDCLFPIPIIEYRGKRRALADALGYAVGTIDKALKPDGGKHLTLPMAQVAAKICEAKISELTDILSDLRAREKALQAKADRPKGFMVVKVRDKSGIPRNARGRGQNNEPGF